MHVHMHMHRHMPIHTHTCMCIYIYICIERERGREIAHMHVRLHMYVCVYVYNHICIYTYTRACVYYICAHTEYTRVSFVLQRWSLFSQTSESSSHLGVRWHAAHSFSSSSTAATPGHIQIPPYHIPVSAKKTTVATHSDI